MTTRKILLLTPLKSNPLVSIKDAKNALQLFTIKSHFKKACSSSKSTLDYPLGVNRKCLNCDQSAVEHIIKSDFINATPTSNNIFDCQAKPAFLRQSVAVYAIISDFIMAKFTSKGMFDCLQR